MGFENQQTLDLAALVASTSEQQGQILVARTSWEIAEQLIAAGYRKFEIVDEPAAPADGGPAFGELKQVGDRAIKQGGLTIRDYFAIHANADEVTRLQRCCVENLEDFQARYRYADQMLKERAK